MILEHTPFQDKKLLLANKTFFTDSLKVEVNNIEVDTTKQGLYDIKPLIEVEKSPSNWWKYLLIGLLIIGIVSIFTLLVYLAKKTLN